MDAKERDFTQKEIERIIQTMFIMLAELVTISECRPMSSLPRLNEMTSYQFTATRNGKEIASWGVSF